MLGQRLLGAQLPSRFLFGTHLPGGPLPAFPAERNPRDSRNHEVDTPSGGLAPPGKLPGDVRARVAFNIHGESRYHCGLTA